MLATTDFADLLVHELAGLGAGSLASTLIPAGFFDGSLIRHRCSPVFCYSTPWHSRPPTPLGGGALPLAQRARQVFDPSKFPEMDWASPRQRFFGAQSAK